MAKTQYSFSTDASLKGAPSGHTVAIREVRLSAGAEFIVVVTGQDHDHARPAPRAGRQFDPPRQTARSPACSDITAAHGGT
jgi:hypothetical protein